MNVSYGMWMSSFITEREKWRDKGNDFYFVVNLKFNVLLPLHVNMYLSTFQTPTLCTYFSVMDSIKYFKI